MLFQDNKLKGIALIELRFYYYKVFAKSYNRLK